MASEGDYIFIVSSSKRMTKKDHSLRVAQTRSVASKRVHRAKAKPRGTNKDANNFPEPASGKIGPPVELATIMHDDIDEELRSGQGSIQRTTRRKHQPASLINLAQPILAASKHDYLTNIPPSVSYDLNMAVDFSETVIS